jgi:hypothetical protein
MEDIDSYLLSSYQELLGNNTYNAPNIVGIPSSHYNSEIPNLSFHPISQKVL